MSRLLQSSWTASLLGMFAYLATLVCYWHPVALPPVAAQNRPSPHAAGPSWVFSNPEMDLLMAELKSQKEALGAKEKDLNDLAARLQTERAELSQLTQAVEQVQAEFDQNVTRVRQEEAANLKKLAKMYSTMTPEGAALILKALDDTTIVKIMSFMKEAESAPLLEALAHPGDVQAKRAAAVSERLRLAFIEAKKPPVTTARTNP